MDYQTIDQLIIAMDFADDPEKLNMLKSYGREFELDGQKYYWFAIAEDGSCALFDKDYNIDDLSKIKEITNEMIRKDIKCIIIPDSVKSIEEGAFKHCKSLTSINIPDSVKSIGEDAFSQCKSLTSINIPNSVKSIGYGAFFCCESFESIIIPDSVESIGDFAFSNCYSLKCINIPDSVKSIGYQVFAGCISLKEVIFKGKTLDEVKSMSYYPWRIKDESIIKVEF